MGEALVRLHVLKDSKDGHFHSFSYNVAPEELLKMRLENPPVALKGLKGECFSANEDKEICKGGLLHAIGFSDVNLPMVVALTKTKHGQFTLGQLITDPKSLSGLKPKELVLAGEQDVTKVTHKIVQDIRRKLVTAAQAKMVSMQNPDMTAKKMGVSSEQFRFCSMAMEGFLKESKLPDPFSPNEKMTLATLTNYMNNEVINPRAPARLPATTAAVKGKTK